jgi:Cd2+/Zn2+-exporting ATPase
MTAESAVARTPTTAPDNHESGRAPLFTRERQVELGRIALVGLITGAYWRGAVPLWLLLAAVAVGLYPLLKTGLLDLGREHKIGTELFVTVATTIAVLSGEYVAASVLMTIILIAEFIAELNTDRARASINALVGAAPRRATQRSDDGDRVVPVDTLRPGDIVLVRAGETIPVDGTVTSGGGAVNEATITGESLPIEKKAGGSVLAGTLLESGALDVRTDKVGADTLFARIISLVEQAESGRAPVQKLADRVAAWLIPVVFVFLLAVYVFTHDARKIVTLLIFTSPAELGLATPLVMIAGIARAARHGILLKGGVYLELLARVDAIAFDKTGTLTRGVPDVVAVDVLDPSLTEDAVLEYAASADRRSSHPLAAAILRRAQLRGVSLLEPTAFEDVRGRGVKATIDGHTVWLGNRAWLSEQQISAPDVEAGAGHTVIYVALDGHAVALIKCADAVRPGARETVARLKEMGVRRVVMLTGDGAEAARATASSVGIDDVRAELSPEDKVRVITQLRAEGLTVAMVGDGVNDAPALATADVGIAMGARGTQAALEAADVALMADDLSKIVLARVLARRAYRTIQENLLVGVGVVHLLGIAAALAGWIGPIQAAMLHLGPDVLVFLNSIKLLRVDLGVQR